MLSPTVLKALAGCVSVRITGGPVSAVNETGGLVEDPRLLVTTTLYSTVALALQTLVSTT